MSSYATKEDADRARAEGRDPNAPGFDFSTFGTGRDMATTTNENVDEYMGKQVANPTMPSQGQYIPQSQQIQPGEEISPEAYALQGSPNVPISQAQTAMATGPTVSPAATVEPLTPEELKQMLEQSKKSEDDDCLMCGS